MSSAPQQQSTGFDPARLIEAHQVGVWRYLRMLGAEPSLADDLTQETFLAILQRPFDDYNPAATATYLRRVAHNQFITFKRRRGREVAVENIEVFQLLWERWAGQDNGDAAVDALRDCLHGLSDRARLALEMRFRERSSRAEIAAALELTEHGAKNLMQRAKQKLRSCIETKLR